MFYEQNYNAFPTWLSFITKLNFNQLNIKKNKIDEDNFGKKYYKQKNTKEIGKKTMWGKIVSFHSVLWGKTCIYL
jgi:NADH:ubiquinone oxidoreductase subunit